MVNITSITVREDDGDLVASAHIAMPEKEGEAWYRLPLNSETDTAAAADAFFAIGIILAMGSDGVLSMDEPVSKRLVYNKRAIEEIFLTWYPDKLQAFELDVPVREKDPAALVDKTVSCFTGGVDSFDTFVNNTDDINALLFVHGFDIRLDRTEIRAATSAHLQQVSADTGKELIEVVTNVRTFLNRAATWPLVTHGAAISSVGHLLSARFGNLLLPASYTYSEVYYPWGTHPLLDHRWSSNRLSVVQDGSGSSRVKKIVGFLDNQVARDHLRVCWQNTGKYNCGECEKCQRTMITLQIAGVLPEFKTFDSEVSLDDIRAMKVNSTGRRTYAEHNLEYAETRGATEIATVLRKKIQTYEKRTAKKAAAGDPKAQAALTQGAPPKPVSSPATKALENRLARVEKTVDRLQKMWPVRSWDRFATWRHGK